MPRHPQHFGYQPGEVPAYDDCRRCGRTLRVDRLDLLAEHDDLCQPELPLALELLVGRRRR